MKIPKKIKIGDKHYRVKAVKKLMDKDRLLFGRILYTKNLIQINKSFPMKHAETLVHEILHGIDDYMNTKLSESQVDRLATGIRIAAQDNKHLFKHILK